MDLFTKTLILVFLLIGLQSSAQLTLEGAYAENSELTSDYTAPITDLLRTEARDFIFGPATRIKFKIMEEGSGLAITYYKIADLPYMKSDGRQMVPHDLADGSYDIKYYSIDNNGNQEQVRESKIYIDKKGPKISSEFGSSPTSFKNGVPIFSDKPKLTVTAADEQVKVHKLTFKINDGPSIVSTNAAFIDLTDELSAIAKGPIKIEIKAYDTFYNLSKETVEFIKE